MLDRVKALADTTYRIYLYAGKQYGEDRVNRMSAAVAYRALFAAAPLLLIAIYVLGLVVGRAEARSEILDALARIGGEQVVNVAGTLMDSLSSTSTVTGIVGIVLLLWTSSTLFLELQNDLNDIFGVPYEQTTGIFNLARKRGLGFLWALGLGLILIVVLLLNNIWQFLGNLFPARFEPVHDVITLLTPLVSAVVLPFVFVLFFQSLTQVKVRWRAVWWGSFFTSVAVLLASYGAGIYFRLSANTAAGIAGALFVILLLFYIFSAVFLFGAEVTKAYDLYLSRGRRPPGVADDETPADSVVDEVEPSVSMATLLGFLAGLFVGWGRRR